jgi:hypothetical protein
MSEEKERECKCEPHFEMPQEVMCSRCHEPLGERYKPKKKEFTVPISEWNKERFALYLLGDKWQNMSAENAELQNRLSTLEKERNKYQGQYFHAIEELESFYQNQVGEEYHHPHFHIVCHELELTQKENKSLESKLSTLLKASEGLEKALEALINSTTTDYETQAKKYLKPEFVGKSRVWSEYGCWLYPDDCVIEAGGEEIKEAKKCLADFRAVKEERT